TFVNIQEYSSPPPPVVRWECIDSYLLFSSQSQPLARAASQRVEDETRENGRGAQGMQEEENKYDVARRRQHQGFNRARGTLCVAGERMYPVLPSFSSIRSSWPSLPSYHPIHPSTISLLFHQGLGTTVARCNERQCPSVRHKVKTSLGG